MAVKQRMDKKLQKPLLVYDADCGFCIYWVDRWRKITGDKIDYAPYQEVANRFSSIPIKKFQKAAALILPSGKVLWGAKAVLRALASNPKKRWMFWLYAKVPGAWFFLEFGYWLIARNRAFFSQFIGPSNPQVLTRWLFLRALGVCYFIAFLSFSLQIPGLIGDNGIWPSSDFLSALLEGTGPGALLFFPTLAWLYPGGLFLQFLGFGGVILSIILVIGFWVRPALLLLWIFYLSLVTTGFIFMAFQWDAALLEIGFLSFFLTTTSTAAVWLIRVVLFKLMFFSGIVKLVADSAWRNFTALNYHYETQPIPNAVSWYMHQLPEWVGKSSVGFMFFVQLILPIFIFVGPRWLRILSGFAFILLETLLFLTGNFGFFNLLTVALVILLFDDDFLRHFMPGRVIKKVMRSFTLKPTGNFSGIFIKILAVIIIFLTISQASQILLNRTLPFSGAVSKITSPLRMANRYGLFAVMTKTRPEISIEGSNDGETWVEYDFRYKPDDVNERPRWFAPHMPRMDWRMWFVALGAERTMANLSPEEYQYEQWFVNLMVRLLQGSNDVEALFAANPFPKDPPKYIRAVLYQYHFTNFEEKRSTGAWWKRERVGVYFPETSL